MFTLLACLALAPADGTVAIARFELVRPVARAGRVEDLVVELHNSGDTDLPLTLALTTPPGVDVVRGEGQTTVEAYDTARLNLAVRAPAEIETSVTLWVHGPDGLALSQELPIYCLPALAPTAPAYIPTPQPVRSNLLVGAHHCPLWEADRPEMWNQLLIHPERTPALGFYDGALPEVADWETKFAVEHGIDFFIYCWYRVNQGGPVETRWSDAMHEGLFNSRFEYDLRWTIMWENQSRGTAGVADEADLFDNLLPYWIETYFSRDSYLKVDGKPVLFIYRPEFLVDDLGGEAQVAAALDRMREVCREAGFEGLYILGEYRGLDPEHLALMSRLGLDYTFAYVWYVGGNPTPEQAIARQMEYLRTTEDLGIIPQVATVSQAWSGWQDEGTIWKIPPTQYRDLLAQAKTFVEGLAPETLSSRMLLLDNWNEWGEGHYIAPYREYGFGYLDAVREVIAGNTDAHIDHLPEDVGRGPYDTAYWQWRTRSEEQRRLGSRRVVGPGGDADGLVGWWTFDEPRDELVAYDYSGHRLGAALHEIVRVPGLVGSALDCTGGTAVVPYAPLLSPDGGFSVEASVWSDVPDQGNAWFLNRVLAGSVTGGYRFGLVGGKPTFQVPETDWSHHLTSEEPLPLGRWVHLAGTFDGQTMRLYVDGTEHGSMERSGPVNPAPTPLLLGNYDLGHVAYFHGLLDEVKLWHRVLTPAEVRAAAAAH